MSKTAREVIATALLSPQSRAEGLPPLEMELRSADSILQALKEEGYVVVPREPTKSMRIAGDGCIRVYKDSEKHLRTLRARDAYCAMISAADGE